MLIRVLIAKLADVTGPQSCGGYRQRDPVAGVLLSVMSGDGDSAGPSWTGVRADAEYDRIRCGFGFGGRAGIDECNKYLHRTLKLGARRYSPN